MTPRRVYLFAIIREDRTIWDCQIIEKHPATTAPKAPALQVQKRPQIKGNDWGGDYFFRGRLFAERGAACVNLIAQPCRRSKSRMKLTNVSTASSSTAL